MRRLARLLPTLFALTGLVGLVGCDDRSSRPEGDDLTDMMDTRDAGVYGNADAGVDAGTGGQAGVDADAGRDAGADGSASVGGDAEIVGDADAGGAEESDAGAEEGSEPISMERAGCPASPTIDCTELGVDLVGHSCFHARFGPFAEVQALSAHRDSAELPKVDTTHTYFTVRLPAPSGEGAVGYTPRRSGDWAIFSDAGTGLRVLDATGAAVTPSLCHAVSGCDQLPDVGVYALNAGALYRIVLGAAERASVPLVLEYLDDFETVFLLDGDGDGYGSDRLESWLLTECVPPDGYVRLGARTDCDDADPGVHPAAAELCNGLDDDCDGAADEGC